MSPREAPHHLRHQARILAMQALYETDITQHETAAVLDRLLSETEQAAKTSAYARRLVDGITAHQAEIDGLIGEAAPLWPLEQMAKIDKSILRVALYEMLNERGVPYKAAINEAVEIAKIYGSDSSSRFINGVLGAIAGRRLGRGDDGDRLIPAPAEPVEER